MALDEELPKKIVLSFEGTFTKKLKARITKYVDENLTGLTEQEIKDKLVEYTNSRDFEIRVLNTTKMTCINKALL